MINQRPDVEALQAAGDVQGLIWLLRSEADPTIRFWAAVALGELGDPQALGPLGELLSDPKALPRRGAAVAMGRLGDRQGTPALAQALGDSDPEVRKCAAEALGEIGDPSSTALLLQALGDDSWLVRCYGAEALGKLGDARAVPALIAALGDVESIVRERAARSLAALDTPEARRALLGGQPGERALPNLADLYNSCSAETNAAVELAVDQLVVLVDCETGRIPASDDSLRRAREIGSRLHSAGGIVLMEHAVGLLRARRPLWHELVAAWWDGIGDWLY